MKDETIHNTIIEIFRKYPETRDNDNLLILRFLINHGFAYRKGDKLIIDMLKFEQIPMFESIRRTRQTIQNTENLYLPTEQTQIKRKEKEMEYRTKYSTRARVYEMKGSQYSF